MPIPIETGGPPAHRPAAAGGEPPRRHRDRGRVLAYRPFFGGSLSTFLFGVTSTFFCCGPSCGAGCGPHGQVLSEAFCTGVANCGDEFRLVTQPLRKFARGDGEIAVGILRKESAIAGRSVDQHRLVPRHQAAMAGEPVLCLQAARRALIEFGEGFIRFIGAVGDDDFVGDFDRLALQVPRPFLHGLLGGGQFRTRRRLPDEFEILRQ